MPDPETVPLASDFPEATRDDWARIAQAVLKGAPLERLVSTTYDGISIEPLAPRRGDAGPLVIRRGATAWQALARIDQIDPAIANESALEELNGGANGLWLVFEGAIGDYGYALPADDTALARILDGVDLTAGISVELDLSPHAAAAIDAALAKGLAARPGAANLRIGHDPLGAATLANSAPRPWSEEATHFGRRAAALTRTGFGGKLAAADGRVIHNAGGSEAEELGYVLSVGIAYLRALESGGLALDAARRLLFFRLSADADQFLTIAKFRSLRKLWARIEHACGLAAEPIFVSAETAWRMMTQRDPHTNILRETIAVFSAAAGGADAITVLPFTAAREIPDDFARRTARNTQLVLADEAFLAKVADPGAGSGAIETLTDQLSRAAWALFQEIEMAGGAAAAIETGLIQNKVAAVRAKRGIAVARRRDALIGATLFPDLAETEPSIGQARRARTDLNGKPLAPIRLAEPFEALRDISDRMAKASGQRPKIFLANLGTAAEFTARGTFAKNFFEAGGIEAVGGEGDAQGLASAFTASGAALACLCSTDDRYDKEAAAVAQALKMAGAKYIYLAGRPGERENAFKSAGVQAFIYDGCDVLATLRHAYDILDTG
ncbi:MAG: methylmalonyl-CoA mutase subunit beta [Xanthobacteraceae bacterium]|jgi:methylmalonyl-CoA mutase